MTHTPQELANEILELPTADRGRLAVLLIQSLEPDSDADAEQIWSDEIEQRLRAIDEGRVPMIPWAEARRRIRGEDGKTAH